MSSKTRLKVCLLGGDKIGWALDYELELTRRALDFVTFTNIFRCDVIHVVNWPVLLGMPARTLVGKRIISHLPHDPINALRQPGFEKATQLVCLWVVRSKNAKQHLESWGLKAQIVPYILDKTTFFHLPETNPRIQQLADRWLIPRHCYLIGSFQRDTEGKDLQSPKLVKGPDIFARIVEEVWRRHSQVHIVLAGPRRFWLRKRLAERGVPFTYVGKDIREDDLRINALPREEVNVLYNLIDLYLVSSRLEGGPQAVIEAAATRCKIVTSNVGHARDILHPDCVFDEPLEAVEIIEEDIKKASLDHTLDYNIGATRSNLPCSVRPLWQDLYKRLLEVSPVSAEQVQGMASIVSIAWARLKGRIGTKAGLSTKGK